MFIIITDFLKKYKLFAVFLFLFLFPKNTENFQKKFEKIVFFLIIQGIFEKF